MLKALEKLSKGEHAFIVCIGDSITEQNIHLNGKLNYVGQLTERLMDRYNRKSLVLNAGISGDTTWGVLERLERDVLNFKPDLVTVMLGINDCRKGLEFLSEFKSNLQTIINRIRESGGEVLLCTQNMLDYQMIEPNITSRIHYPAYIAAIREVAEADRVALCDIYQKWGEHTKGAMNAHLKMLNDSAHPNECGHTFIAKVLFDYLGLEN